MTVITSGENYSAERTADEAGLAAANVSGKDDLGATLRVPVEDAALMIGHFIESHRPGSRRLQTKVSTPIGKNT